MLNASNPSITASVDWAICMLSPWLDIVRTKTADHGELWSFTTDPDGKYLKVRGLDDIRTFDHVD